MTVTAFRIALGASVLVLSAGAALSDAAPAKGTQPAAAGGNCSSAQAQPASRQLINASTTARHTNVIRVRYAAAHAMPPVRKTAGVTVASCSLPAKGATTALD
jgi:hypothetical protein